MSAFGQTRLGFGCAHLPGRLARREALAVLETAFDAGIRHFDVARMYGDGQAEGIVGAFARGRRAELSLVTKAGITPASHGIAARTLRQALHAAPALATFIPAAARDALAPRFGQFAPAQIRDSLEKSLRELQTDYIDALLLHECAPHHVTDELKLTLERLKADGKIKRWGIACLAEPSRALITTHPDLCDVVQVAAAADVRPLPDAALIVHSVLGRRLAALAEKLEGDAALAARFQAVVSADPRDRSALAAVLIQWELQRRPDAMVLFSSTAPARIRRNAALSSAGGTPAGLASFMQAIAT